MDTIVGENGSGKSNIVSAFKAFSEMPGTNQIFNKEDYFEGNTNNPIKLQMNISLVDKDILFLIRELDIDMIVQDLEEVFGKDLSRPTYECKKGHEIYLIKNDNYQIHQQ